MADRGEPSDTLTIIVHLPQDVVAISTLLHTINNLWPTAKFIDGLARLEIPGDVQRSY